MAATRAVVKRMLIHDQQEAIRLAKAGMLYWKDPSGKVGCYSNCSGWLLHMWSMEYENYKPHILVEDEDEEDNGG